MNKTDIEWADSTWNPVTGCRYGCGYCYAKGIAERFTGHWDEERLRTLGANGGIHDLERPMNRHTSGKNRDVPVHSVQAPYPYGLDPTFHRYRLGEPARKTKGRNIFVCSMADLFGEWVPDEWIEAVFEACRAAPQHNYLFLTKNYLRACEFKFEDNWWIGRTVTHDEPCGNENKNLYLCYGIPKSAEADWREHSNTFLSCEPLHGPIPDIPYYAHEYGYKWVILGAETGNRKDKVVPQRDWINQIVKDCRLRNVPVFMKDSLASIMGEENMIRKFPEGLSRNLNE